MADQFIERRIVTGLIISTEYIHRIRKSWDSKLLQSRTAKKLATWCIEFYDEYRTAPGEEVESLVRQKAKAMPAKELEDIEDILAGLSDEYEREDKFNVGYLFDQSIQYFEERSLQDFTAGIQDKLEKGNITEAKKAAFDYKPAITISDKDIDLSDPAVLESIEKAFQSASQPVVRYPRQLGQFWNDQLVRGALVGLMGPEKRGKTFLLMDMGMRAAKQLSNVAFFQAGDMTMEQQLMRVCINLAKKSNKKKYCGVQYEPVRDCMWNQLDDCDRKERECDFGIFEGRDKDFIRKNVLFKDLTAALKDNPDYMPCHNCKSYWENKWGAVWLKKVDVGLPLTVKQAKRVLTSFFIENKRRFKLSSHPTKTLTVSEIDAKLDLWEREDGFVVDVILVDYADILAPEIHAEFRHQENDKWMRLRGLSEKRHALVVTGTQADADSYDRDRLSLKNFSEDKRKFGHVTAMYGLNQDRSGREKAIGIMRVNPIVVREDDFLASNEVYVLQNLRRGQPCLASYW